MNQVFLIEYAQKIIKVANPFQFARNIPGFSPQSPMSQEPLSPKQTRRVGQPKNNWPC
mgnify:CR=1 FL=1